MNKLKHLWLYFLLFDGVLIYDDIVVFIFPAVLFWCFHIIWLFFLHSMSFITIFLPKVLLPSFPILFSEWIIKSIIGTLIKLWVYWGISLKNSIVHYFLYLILNILHITYRYFEMIYLIWLAALMSDCSLLF